MSVGKDKTGGCAAEFNVEKTTLRQARLVGAALLVGTNLLPAWVMLP